MEGQVGQLDAGPISADSPVFASGRGSKGKFAVRAGVLALIGLLTVWLVALILGAIGFGNLPDLHLPGARGSDSSTHTAAASAVPAGVAGAIDANGVIRGTGGGSTSGTGGGSSGSLGSSGSGPSGSGSGGGRGPSTEPSSGSGGRGAPDTTPSGKNTPGNGHGKGKGLTK